MSNTTLHWELRNIAHHLKDEGRLSVLIMYVLHANERNRAWPSVETLMKETGFGLTTVIAAKRWLVEHGALEPVALDLRAGIEIKLHHRCDVMQLTGKLCIEGKAHPILHFNEYQSEEVIPSPSKGLRGKALSADTEVNAVDLYPDLDQFDESEKQQQKFTRAHPRLAFLVERCGLLNDFSIANLSAWIEQYSIDRVHLCARWYYYARNRGIAHKGGWLRRALEEGYSEPDGFRPEMYLSEEQNLARYQEDWDDGTLS